MIDSRAPARVLAAILAVLALAALARPAPARAQGGGQVLVLTMDAPVSAVMNEYLQRGLRLAESRDAEAVIFQLNTPGGAIDLTLDIVAAIRASPVPVVVYVAPRGAIAGSAGTVITLAGHAAAMAPETAIGAASPVGGQGEELGETLEAKIKESLKATVRSLAERRPPEAVELAEDTIENAVAASASEALAVGMVDFLAADLDDLLAQLDGTTVETAAGTRTIDTANATVTDVPLTLIEQLLEVLTNPNIVFLLLTVGVQAVLIELGNPGAWVPGFIGVSALALATFGMGLLPVNWFGIIFLVTAFVLFVLDVKAPTHGALTAAGAASFIVGALVLFNSPGTPGVFRVSVPLVVGSGLLTAGTFAVVMTFALRAQREPVRTGKEALVGRAGKARSGVAPKGTVQVGGEVWSARLAEGEAPLEPGDRVEVVAAEGLQVVVRRLREKEGE